MRHRLLMLLAALALLPAAGQPAAAAGQTLTVFAAASLADVLEEVGRAYTSRSRTAVRFSFAASSALARQIESGAPADVFVSADQEWMDYLERRGLLAGGTRRDVVSNRLVLVAPADSRLQLRIAPGFALAAALGRRGRLATADPGSVPAGRYARAALVSLGVWNSVEDRLVPADNVRTALGFVARGETPLGIVYATDARDEPRVRVIDTFAPATHPAIRYPAAAIHRADSAAADFVRFLAGPEARSIFTRAGFDPPPG